MIKEIKITKYKKLQNISFEFKSGVNAISGSNGTCKTSLLHIISNSFQTPTRGLSYINDKKCLPIINALNYMMNPKIESLNRGDSEYNDPARGISGTLFSVAYLNGLSLDFRRHNSDLDSRYSIKPKYARGSGDKLPSVPVIYLGLTRLVPYGEFHNDSNVTKITKKLPAQYQNEITLLYKSFTNYEISPINTLHLGDIKTRNIFKSNIEGVDSNTISAGEDNLNIILTALVSLKYYFNSITSSNDVESILLIDELDATLHPSYQIKLLRLLEEMSRNYKIQVIFTTHSLSLMEYVIKRKDNIIYLIDNLNNVSLMPSPNIYKIRMHLLNKSAEDIYSVVSIPIFSEDEEARLFIDCLLENYKKKHSQFGIICNSFYFVNASIGADVLESIFKDFKLGQINDRAICILDGDHDTNLNNLIVALPGGKAPEIVVFDYLDTLYDADDFWNNNDMINYGYSKLWYKENIKDKINSFKSSLEEKRNKGESTKGLNREFNKKMFIDYNRFFQYVIRKWINDESNRLTIEKFYTDLKIAYKRVAVYYQIDPDLWCFDQSN